MNSQRNEGQGNRTAAGRFNEDERGFVKSNKLAKAANEAKRATLSDLANGLRQAEREGLRKARH